MICGIRVSAKATSRMVMSCVVAIVIALLVLLTWEGMLLAYSYQVEIGAWGQLRSTDPRGLAAAGLPVGDGALLDAASAPADDEPRTVLGYRTYSGLTLDGNLDEWAAVPETTLTAGTAGWYYILFHRQTHYLRYQ